MKYLSCFSGIEAASVAWEPLGWKPVGFSEVASFPSAVLKHRFPNTPNYGDITKWKDWGLVPGTVDLVVGGSPCQSFSLCGKRLGLDDPRGELALVYLGLVNHLKPRWFVWENVVGVLNSNEGRDFAAFLDTMGDIGYHCAYRVLNSVHFGVPQSRRRVFLVGYLGDWRPAAAVLFEQGNVPGDPSAEPSQGRHSDAGSPAKVPGAGIPMMHPPIAFQPGNLRRRAGACPSEHHFPTLKKANGDQSPHIALNYRVRKLCAIETERLQGFPDNWTQVPWNGKPAEECSDSQRQMACGNSMSVPVMSWIGSQISKVDALIQKA